MYELELCEKRSSEYSVMPQDNLEDIMNNLGDTFKEKMFYLIDQRGLKDSEVYKRANLDRKLFSKIRCSEKYKPKKKTVLALAIALQLNLEETKDLLSRAEMALSPSSKFNLIIEYFILRKEYDIHKINMALFNYGEETLGA